MPYTTYLRNKLQAHWLGATAYTAPDPLWLGLHLATQLTAEAASAQDTIVVAHAISVGVSVTLAPGTVNAETHQTTNVSGSGPYTVTLDGNLAATHAVDTYVAYNPGPNGENIREPSGDGYGRVEIANDTDSFPAPADGESGSGEQFTFGTATDEWGKATHAFFADDETAGNILAFGALTSTPLLDETSNPISFPAGNVVAEMT